MKSLETKEMRNLNGGFCTFCIIDQDLEEGEEEIFVPAFEYYNPVLRGINRYESAKFMARVYRKSFVTGVKVGAAAGFAAKLARIIRQL